MLEMLISASPVVVSLCPPLTQVGVARSTRIDTLRRAGSSRAHKLIKHAESYAVDLTASLSLGVGGGVLASEMLAQNPAGKIIGMIPKRNSDRWHGIWWTVSPRIIGLAGPREYTFELVVLGNGCKLLLHLPSASMAARDPLPCYYDSPQGERVSDSIPLEGEGWG